jgi:pyruvate/2-oxoglutarate dehydrogenase complex dihydrolipoamide dehydrogenase (E3) component
MATEQYDAIIIGAGQGGMPLSRALAGAGRKTAIIESTHVGGTCINEGCTPTKTMVASARVAYLAGRAADYGVNTGPVSVDMARVRQRKRDIVDDFRGSNERRLGSTENLDLIMGEARFVDNKVVEVRLNDGGNTRTLTAGIIVINTGTRPSEPQLAGAESVTTLNSTTIMELDVVPEHLLVLGGGFVGLEFAQMFRRFGSRVTVIQHGKRLLTREDADIAEAVGGILREDGIDVLLDTEAERVAPAGGGKIELTIRPVDGGDERVLSGSHLLVAIGRTPNTDRLNVEVSGVQTDKRGFVSVDERLQTNVPGIYAIGDVNGGPQLTHISYDDFRILRANLLEGGNATTTGRQVPYTVFTDPQLGHVGISEEEARKQGLNIKVAKMPMNWVARALEVGESRGLMKAIVDADTEQILGCAILGIEAGEVMAMIEIAMLGKIRYPVLREAIFAHPTLAESLNNLFGSFGE